MVDIRTLNVGDRVVITEAAPAWLNELRGTVVEQSYESKRVRLDDGQETLIEETAVLSGTTARRAIQRYREWQASGGNVSVYAVELEAPTNMEPDEHGNYTQAQRDAIVRAAARQVSLVARKDEDEWKDQAVAKLAAFADTKGLCSDADEALREAGFSLEKARKVKVTLELTVQVPVRGGSEDVRVKGAIAQAVRSAGSGTFQGWITNLENVES